MHFGNYPDVGVYHQVTRTAHKVHSCDGCRRPVVAGEMYVFGRGFLGGKAFSIKTCGACELLRWLVHVYELADGCDWIDSWCQLDELTEAAEAHGIEPPTIHEGQRFLTWEQLMQQTLTRLIHGGTR